MSLRLWAGLGAMCTPLTRGSGGLSRRWPLLRPVRPALTCYGAPQATRFRMEHLWVNGESSEANKGRMMGGHHNDNAPAGECCQAWKAGQHIGQLFKRGGWVTAWQDDIFGMAGVDGDDAVRVVARLAPVPQRLPIP